MLLKELARLLENKGDISKNHTRDVEKYFGEIEKLKRPKTLIKSAIKETENAPKHFTKKIEVALTEVENFIRTASTIKQQTITTTITTKEVTRTQEVFENNEQEIIETTVVFVDSDDDVFEEEEQEFSDTDDVFNEKSDPLLNQFEYPLFVENCTEKKQTPDLHQDSEDDENVSVSNEKDSIIDLTELNELESRIKEKESIDINENNLNDEDVDDIFSEEEYFVSYNNQFPKIENKTLKNSADDKDDVFEERIANNTNQINKSTEEKECSKSRFPKAKISLSKNTDTNVKHTKDAELSSYTTNRVRKKANKKRISKKANKKINGVKSTFPKGIIYSSKNSSKTTQCDEGTELPAKGKSEHIGNLYQENKSNKKTDGAKSTFPKAIYYPPKNCKPVGGTELSTKLNQYFTSQMDVEGELPAFLAVNRTVTEQNKSYHTNQKTVVSGIFQHTENTVQMASYVRNTNSLLNEKYAANTKQNLEMSTYLQTVSPQDSLQNRFCVVTDDNLSKKLSNSRSNLKKEQNSTKSFCTQECCSPLEKNGKKLVSVDKIILDHRNNRQTEKTVFVETKKEENQSIKKELMIEPKKKKIKLPPLIPIPKTSSVRPTKTLTKTKYVRVKSPQLIYEQKTKAPNQDSIKLTGIYNQESHTKSSVQHILNNTSNNLDTRENKTTFEITRSSSDNFVTQKSKTAPNEENYRQISINYNQQSNTETNVQNHSFDGNHQISNKYGTITNQTEIIANYYAPNNNNIQDSNNARSYYVPNQAPWASFSYGQRSNYMQNCMNWGCYDARCPDFQAPPIQDIAWCCHMCMANFTQKHFLFSHLKYHVDPNYYWFYCQKCEFVTISMLEVQNHLTQCKMEEMVYNNRGENQRFVCHLCSQEFVEKLAVHNHIQEHFRMNTQYATTHMM